MVHLHLDLETFSPVSIADCGVYKYAASPDFRILLCSYCYNDGPVRIIDVDAYDRGNASEEDGKTWRMILSDLSSPNVIKHAHNAVFERVCLTNYLRRYDKEHNSQYLIGQWLNPEQWDCSMVQCARCGLPLSLDQAGEALKLENRKMKEGKALIKLFCTPQEEAGPLMSDQRVRPEENPEKWETFKQYCIRDTEVEVQICKMTDWYPVTEQERQVYALDQRINDYGAMLDMKMVQNAIHMDNVYKAQLSCEAAKITGLSNPNSIAQLKQWFSAKLGEEILSLDKANLSDLRTITNDADVLRMIAIRQELGKTSCKKYEAMKDVVGSGDRVRGLMQYHGTRTGRWAGRLVQVQNLPQNHIPDMDFARQAVIDNDRELIELTYGNVPDTLSQLIRTAFIAPKGKTLAVCDFSAIEARVIAWLAGENWVLDVFRQGGDIYCSTASKMFSVPVEKHGQNAHLRQKGKIAVLALGYGGGSAALDAMGGQRMGLTELEEKDIVSKWRSSNPHIVDLWYTLEDCANTAVTTGQVTAYRSIRFKMEGKTLAVTLPSGRIVSYPDIAPCTNRFGSQSLKFHGVNQETRKWQWVETYGGKLTENIIQAIARDCLAEVMLRIAKRGIQILFHVHDEVICEVNDESALDIIKEEFAKSPVWAPELPLKGAGYCTPYYLKD